MHKKIGIIGGLSPESTVSYYLHITRTYVQRFGDYGYPEIIIYSVNLAVRGYRFKMEKIEKSTGAAGFQTFNLNRRTSLTEKNKSALFFKTIPAISTTMAMKWLQKQSKKL